MLSQKAKQPLSKRESYYSKEDANKAIDAYIRQHKIGQIKLHNIHIEKDNPKKYVVVISYNFC